jgi:hypothetical protein
MPENVLGVFKSGIYMGFCEFQTTASQTPVEFRVLINYKLVIWPFLRA